MMLKRIKKLLAPPVFEGEEEKTRITRLLNGILWALIAMSVIIAPPIIIFNETASSRITSIALIGTTLLATLGLLWLMRSGLTQLASSLLLLILLITLGISMIFFGGIHNVIATGYLLVIATASLLLGRRGTIIFGLLSLLAVAGIYWGQRTYEGIPIFPMPQISFGDLIIFFGISTLMAVLMSFALYDLTEALERARRGEQELAVSNRELRASRNALQATMFDLEHRNKQIRLASEVARDAAAAQDLEQILERAVNLMQARFDLYHVGLFLIDERREYAVLRAAAGYGAKQILEQGFQVRVDRKSALGQFAITGTPYIVQETGEDPTYLEHPILKEAQSRAILPLRVGEETIGVIGIQRQDVNAFREDDIAVLQIMTDQLAVAIENARLLHNMQQAVHEMEAASGRYTRESWRAVGQRAGRPPGYRYRHKAIDPITEQPPEVRQAWLEGRRVVDAQNNEEQEGVKAAAIPIKLREETIGVFDLRSSNDTISSEALSLVEDIADRLALALENARLLEDTQRRAAREHLTREITDKMRRAASVESIVQTAVDELYEALGTTRAFVRLGVAPSSQESVEEQGHD
jgi:GAF domain-containing protein